MPVMASKLTGDRTGIQNPWSFPSNWLLVVFWLVVIATLFFFGLIFIGLLIYGSQISWKEVLGNPEVRFATGLTLKTTLLAALLALITALPCAYVLARYHFPGKIFLDTLLDLPLVLPPLVSGLALLILFGPVLGHIFARLGIAIVFTTGGVVVAQWFIAVPFTVKMLRETFEGIDSRYERMARVLGCTWAKAFFTVTLPMAGRGIGAAAAMTWARTLGEFGATAMLAGVTRMKTETLPVAIFLNMSIGELRLAIAISLMLFLTAMLILGFFKILTRRKVRT